MPSCFGRNDHGCLSGINRILIYIPDSQICHLTCHPVCMQLPMNASLAFFGFIMYYPLLDGHVGFWQFPSIILGERGGLVDNASDSGSRGRDSNPTRVKPSCVLEQGTFTPPKVLVIPRKRWLSPNMTEKLFTWTLRINQPTNQPSFIHFW